MVLLFLFEELFEIEAKGKLKMKLKSTIKQIKEDLINISRYENKNKMNFYFE